jgi:hypothetical protein
MAGKSLHLVDFTLFLIPGLQTYYEHIVSKTGITQFYATTGIKSSSQTNDLIGHLLP